jgi:hypothetical protein
MKTTPDTPQNAPGPNPPSPLIFEVRTAPGTTPGNEASERWTVVTVRGVLELAGMTNVFTVEGAGPTPSELRQHVPCGPARRYGSN